MNPFKDVINKANRDTNMESNRVDHVFFFFKKNSLICLFVQRDLVRSRGAKQESKAAILGSFLDNVLGDRERVSPTIKP